MTDLVPITREVLKRCYDKHPMEPVPQELHDKDHELDTMIVDLSTKLSSAGIVSAEAAEAAISAIKITTAPHKMDENISLNRMQLEEIVHLCEQAGGFGPGNEEATLQAKELAGRALAAWEGYQRESMEKVDTLVKSFLPNDFRLSIYNTFRARSKANFEYEVATLMANGGSIKDKYDLVWKHQLEQRQSLVNLGNASGIWKALIAILAGVPASLLDFVKTINDDHGPMDEFRVTYGPVQYFLTLFSSKVRLVFHLARLPYAGGENDAAEKAAAAIKGDVDRCLGAAVDALKMYLAFVEKFIAVLVVVLQDSPFFVSRADVDSVNAESGQEVQVLVNYDHTIKVPVLAGDVFSWEFRTDKDIKFRASFEPKKADEGEPVDIHPLLLVNSHLAPVKDDFTAPCDGEVKLFFDNTYSWLAKKNMTITTKLTPNPERVQKEFEGLLIEAEKEAKEQIEHQN